MMAGNIFFYWTTHYFMEGVCALIIVLQYIHLNDMVNCSNRCSDRFRDLDMSVKEKLIHHFCKKKLSFDMIRYCFSQVIFD